jgi:hypothetical protein
VIRCWSCGKVTGVIGRPSRSDQCPHCRADLRACRQCKHYDPAAANACRETRAEPPSEKDRSNFCDFYVAAEAPVGGARNEAAVEAGPAAPLGPARSPAEEARAAFDALFKKG